MGRKQIHFETGPNKGYKGRGIACPILETAEKVGFDTLSSRDPELVTCWPCKGSNAYHAARKNKLKKENGWLMKQQEFIDRLFTEYAGNDLSLAVVLWSMGSMSRAEHQMFPTLKAMMHYKFERQKIEGECP